MSTRRGPEAGRIRCFHSLCWSPPYTPACVRPRARPRRRRSATSARSSSRKAQSFRMAPHRAPILAGAMSNERAGPFKLQICTTYPQASSSAEPVARAGERRSRDGIVPPPCRGHMRQRARHPGTQRFIQRRGLYRGPPSPAGRRGAPSAGALPPRSRRHDEARPSCCSSGKAARLAGRMISRTYGRRRRGCGDGGQPAGLSEGLWASSILSLSTGPAVSTASAPAWRAQGRPLSPSGREVTPVRCWCRMLDVAQNTGDGATPARSFGPTSDEEPDFQIPNRHGT
ncbi:uncharacterized protein SOCEGT47_050190 [Sorangium cellulosum]|uniref:Uncharacterized protein n=1 Tax=Sorangium cellulosum TaxID=56 RepID=A0A4P2Q5I6_SORCE|nr:uncharacterized protein SOCEGT47_050190 [Sorangium cellulosum]